MVACPIGLALGSMRCVLRESEVCGILLGVQCKIEAIAPPPPWRSHKAIACTSFLAVCRWNHRHGYGAMTEPCRNLGPGPMLRYPLAVAKFSTVVGRVVGVGMVALGQVISAEESRKTDWVNGIQARIDQINAQREGIMSSIVWRYVRNDLTGNWKGLVATLSMIVLSYFGLSALRLGINEAVERTLGFLPLLVAIGSRGDRYKGFGGGLPIV